jgi:hypothetical protein
VKNKNNNAGSVAGNETNHQPYDLIGDIHGHADELHALLGRLGYGERSGAYRHDGGRRVLFLGDFVDRGPRIRETLRVVRAMHAAGSALAVPGNHELNTLCWHALDGNGNPLRPHTEEKCREHRATLDQFAGHEEELRDHLCWFQTLPIVIEMPGLRAAHATWDAAALATLGRRRTLDDDLLPLAAARGTPEFAAISALLKGVEIPLPQDISFPDEFGIIRRNVRAKWWLAGEGRRYPEMSLQAGLAIPDIPLPAAAASLLAGYAPHERPVFNGHYWLQGEPAPVGPNVAILDYSVARGGALTAYRWDGEQRLDPAKFVQVRTEEAAK